MRYEIGLWWFDFSGPHESRKVSEPVANSIFDLMFDTISGVCVRALGARRYRTRPKFYPEHLKA